MTLMIVILVNNKICIRIYLNNGDIMTNSIFPDKPHAFTCLRRLSTCKDSIR